MALRERLVREAGIPAPISDDTISNQQGFQDMKARLHRMLINRMDLTKLGMLEPEQLHEEVARLAASLLAQEDTPLSTVERERLIHEVRHELFGLGPLEQLLADTSISDILVNSPYNIYIERGGKLERTNIELDQKQVEDFLGERVVGFLQSDYRAAVNSINLGQPLVESAPTSRVTADLRSIAAKLFEGNVDLPAPAAETRRGFNSLFRRQPQQADSEDFGLRAALDRANLSEAQ